MQDLASDLKYSLRSMRKNWRFSIGVILTLTLGIGANTLVYSIVDSVILNPFPFPDPERLVGIGSEWPHLSRDLGFFETLSPAEYRDVQSQTETLDHVVMWDMGFRAVATGPERAEMLLSAMWFDDVFPTLGLNPALGRGFSSGELERGDPVAILSYRVWKTRLAGDANALGQTIQVDGVPYTLIGVMPPRGQIIASDLWIPMSARPHDFPRQARRMEMLARIKAPYTLQDVNTELATISGRIEQEYGREFEEYAGWRMQALPWTEVNVRLAKPAALALLGAVGIVLLIVCANVGSLLLARSAARRQEIAVRSALGAGRLRIVRQLLTESVMLSAISAVAALGLTQLGVSTLAPRLLSRIPFVVIDISINTRVLLFTAFVALVTGLVFGLLPALHGTRSGIGSSLKADGRFATGSISRQRLQRAFVGAEVMVALVLLAQAGLLTNSFIRTLNVDPGFDTTKSLTMRLTLPQQRYPTTASIHGFFDEVIRRVEGLPGVTGAAAGSSYPPILLARTSAFEIEGEVYQTEEELPSAFLTIATEGYHEAVGIPLVRGRTFDSRDTLETPRVAVINEAAAQRYFATGDAIGRRFRSGGQDRPWVEIVGIVRSVRNRGPEEAPQPELYVHLRQLAVPPNQLFLIVRAEENPRALLSAVERQIVAIDSEQSIYAVVTLREAYMAITAPRLAGTLALTFLAAFGLALAGAGIYAVVSFSVTERRQEIGLRVALGASAGAIRRLMVRQAMLPVLVGGGLGLILALLSGVAIRSFLFEVSATDPVTLIGVTVLLLGLAAAASYFPARRASRLDPMVALRDE